MKPSARSIVLLLGALLLAGCAGAPAPGTTLYFLDIDRQQTAPTPAANDTRRLAVAPVELAPILAESGIVYQLAPHQLSVARNHRWAAPLAGQLGQSLARGLDARLADTAVHTPGRSDARPDLRLRMTVDRFMGHYDGHAEISGSWQLLTPGGCVVMGERFDQRRALAVDGYDALVDSLAQSWADLIDGIANAVQSSAAAMRAASRSCG